MPPSHYTQAAGLTHTAQIICWQDDSGCTWRAATQPASKQSLLPSLSIDVLQGRGGPNISAKQRMSGRDVITIGCIIRGKRRSKRRAKGLCTFQVRFLFSSQGPLPGSSGRVVANLATGEVVLVVRELTAERKIRTKPSPLFIPDEKVAGNSPNLDAFHVLCRVAERSTLLTSYDPPPPPPPI